MRPAGGLRPPAGFLHEGAGLVALRQVAAGASSVPRGAGRVVCRAYACAGATGGLDVLTGPALLLLPLADAAALLALAWLAGRR